MLQLFLHILDNFPEQKKKSSSLCFNSSNTFSQVFLGTIPSLRACATERSSSSLLMPWRPRRCTHRAAARTTTTNRSPTRTSSPASCDASADNVQTMRRTVSQTWATQHSELKRAQNEKITTERQWGLPRPWRVLTATSRPDYFSVLFYTSATKTRWHHNHKTTT